MRFDRSLNELTTVDDLTEEIMQRPAALGMLEGSRREMRLADRRGRGICAGT